MGYDPDANLSATGGGSAYFRRLTATRRDLPPLTQERMIDISAWLYDMNPLAKRVLELTRDYVLGDGVTITATAEDEKAKDSTQQAIDGFWDDPVNSLDITLHQYVLDQEVFGELFWSVWVNPVDGHVRLGWIDPIAVAEIVHDPDNATVPVAVRVKGPTGSADKVLRVVQVDESANSSWYGRLVGVETDRQGNVQTTYKLGDDDEEKPYDGACLYFPINQVAPGTRGRSDLLCLADWIDAYDQILFGEVDRASLLKRFIWDVTITGGTDNTIDKYAKMNPAPKDGSVRYHNEKVAWEAVTPDLKAADAAVGMDGLLSYVATGAGRPKTWLNGIMDVNLATATALSEPAFKALSLRQKYVKYLLSQLVTFVLDQAEMHGKLLRRKQQAGTARPEAWPFTVNLPELRPKDLKLAADTLLQAVNGLTVAKAEGVIDNELFQQAVVLLIEQLGIEVDVKALQERLQKIEDEKQAKQEQMPPVVPPPPPNQQGQDQNPKGSNQDVEAMLVGNA